MRWIPKALGLALLAILATSAVAASAASANPQFHFEMENTTMTGSQGQVVANILTFDQGELKCKSVKFSGTSGAVTTTTLTLTPKYEECKLAGENAVVTVNGCGYLFHLAANEENFEASMDIECPDGEKVEIDSPECRITIPPQASLKKVTFTNEGEEATRSIVADLGISGFHYAEDGAACAGEEEATANGTYSGQITVTGENAGGEHKGIWVE